MKAATGSREEFRRGWPAVVASAVGVGLGLSAVPFYTLGVFAGPLAEEFGWGRGDIFVGILLMLSGSVIAAPILGVLIDRFNVRTVVLTSIALFALFLGLLSRSNGNLTLFYGNWFLMSLLGSGTLPITWTRVIGGWFDRARGTALGLALAGTGVTAALLPAYTSMLIDSVGWRGAYLGLAGLVILLSFPTVFFLLRDPRTAEGLDRSSLGPERGLSLREAAASYRFWLIAISISIVSIGISGGIANLVPLLTDNGYEATRAATMAGLVGVAVIGGRIIGGLLVDRIHASFVGFLFLGAPAISCILLAQGAGGAAALVAIALIGLAAGAEFDLVAYFVSRYFGMKHYGKVYGAQFVFFSLGSGIGPAIFGAFYDRTGSYDQILYIAAGLFALGGSLLLLTGPYPDFSRAPAEPDPAPEGAQAS